MKHSVILSLVKQKYLSFLIKNNNQKVCKIFIVLKNVIVPVLLIWKSYPLTTVFSPRLQRLQRIYNNNLQVYAYPTIPSYPISSIGLKQRHSLAADKEGAQQLGTHIQPNIWRIFGKIPRYSAHYHDIRRITMMFAPGLPTEPGQEITAQELIRGFDISLRPVTRLEDFRQQFMAIW